MDVHEALLHDVVYGVVFDTMCLTLAWWEGLRQAIKCIGYHSRVLCIVRGEAKPLEEFPEKDDFLPAWWMSRVLAEHINWEERRGTETGVAQLTEWAMEMKTWL